MTRTRHPAPVTGLAAQYLVTRRQQAREASPLPLSSDTPNPTTAARCGRLTVLTLAGLKPEPIDWLWPGYIPFGKVTVLEGDPGLGKSLLTVDIAAAVATGDYSRLHGARNRPSADVLFVTYEDGVRDTIVPRLMAAGADLSRTHVIQGVRDDAGVDELLALPDDISDLRIAVERYGARLIVVDPLGAALSSRVDSYKDQDVRRALAPLARLAEELGVAILVVRHLTKGLGRSAVLSGAGSTGIGAAARSVLVVGRQEGENARCVLAVVKANIAQLAPSLIYSIEATADQQPVVRWCGTTAVTANDLAAARADAVQESVGQSERETAEALLTEWLAAGPVGRQEILKLTRNHAIAERTLQRAARALGVRYTREGQGREHTILWSLEGVENSSTVVRGAFARPCLTRANHATSKRGASQPGASDRRQVSDATAGNYKGPTASRGVTRASSACIQHDGASGLDLRDTSARSADAALDRALDDEAHRATRHMGSKS